MDLKRVKGHRLTLSLSTAPGVLGEESEHKSVELSDTYAAIDKNNEAIIKLLRIEEEEEEVTRGEGEADEIGFSRSEEEGESGIQCLDSFMRDFDESLTTLYSSFAEGEEEGGGKEEGEEMEYFYSPLVHLVGSSSTTRSTSEPPREAEGGDDERRRSRSGREDSSCSLKTVTPRTSLESLRLCMTDQEFLAAYEKGSQETKETAWTSLSQFLTFLEEDAA
jgi:hypothetical protein